MDYDENGTVPVATYMVSGPESASTTWSLSGDDAGLFDISASGELSFKAAPDFEREMDADTNNVYMVTVEADDGTYMDERNVTIMVTDVDEAPRMISGLPNVSYPENGTGPVVTYTLSGANAASATWTLDGPDAGDFTISGGVLVFRSPPDYETKTTYMVTVKADAGADMDTLDVTVTVTDVDDDPLEISGMSQPMYAENGTGPVATYMLSGANATSAAWTLDGPDAGDFDISNGGVLTFRSPPDYETKTTYMVTVKADAGADMDTLDVTVTVTDVDDDPLEISGMSQPMYAENGTGPVATYMLSGANATSAAWTLEGPDAGDFTIAGGVLVFRSPPDYEMPADVDENNTYMVTVKAADGADIDTHEVIITVTDVDEMAPEMSLLDRYDTNDNDEIDVDELREAITHYILGDIDVDDVREIIRLYILG